MTAFSRSGPGLGRLALIAGIFALAAIGVGALLTNISSRQAEGRATWFRAAEISDTVTDPAIWGRSFPLHYDAYRRTTDMVRTRFGGSEALPRTPTDADPRSVVAQSRLEEDPRLRRIWQGYAFATDFREERGHAYMLDDQIYTERQRVAQQPGACAHCHASVYVPYLRLGEGDLIRGFERMNAMPYQDARPQLEHPVACIDCHDPGTMALRITRPGFMEGMRALKAAEGIAGYDVNTMATRMEMRSFVCGQCHVEYYFVGPDKRLTYPWHRGLLVDSMLAHYEAVDFADWTHGATGARVLKAQHPEFEMWSQGTHARAGVACADCHMPYQRIGAMKISDHHVRSPLLNINKACQTCHKVSEGELLARAEQIQVRTYQLRNTAMEAVVALIDDLEAAVRADSTRAGIAGARRWQRRAQFLMDFVEAENSMGFHAPQEASRILGLAIDAARRGQVALHEP